MTMEILTAILVIITGIYAFLTYKMSRISERTAQIMNEQTEAISRPYIIYPANGKTSLTIPILENL